MKTITKKEISGQSSPSQGVIPQKTLDFMPELYKNSWIEDCDIKIKEWMVKEKKREKMGLYIYGSCGTGKTYALYALYRNCVLLQFPCCIENTVELLRLFKRDFKYENESNFEYYLGYKGLLFIDDIGAEKNTEFVDETLYHLINTRNEKMLPTFFTSNLSLKELAKKNGDRLASRIAGMCEIIKLEGEDKRIKNHE